MSFLIGITGGSASGKTRLARTVQDKLARHGVTLISEDDYYVDAASMPGFDPSTFNFDEPAAKEHDLLVEHLAALHEGRSVDMPLYDFATHGRKAETRRIDPGAVVIVEGLHILNTEALRDAFDLTVYVSSGDALRMARRLNRDVAERSRTVEFARHQFETIVRPMHDRYVEPQKAHADLIIRNDAEPAFEAMADQVLARCPEQFPDRQAT